MAFSIGKVAPNDATETHRLYVLGEPTVITYYRNRLTMEGTAADEKEEDAEEDGPPDDDAQQEETLAYRVANRLATIVKEWDWEGPLTNTDGSRVIVEAGDPIPLDPDVIRYIPLRLTRALNDAIIDNALRGKDKKKPRR